MARTHLTEVLPEENEKAWQILDLLSGLTIDSAETVLLRVQWQLDLIKDRLVISFPSAQHTIHPESS